jgi:hypothetical protein
LVPVGFHDTPRFKLLAVGKEDGLAKVAMFDGPLLAPIPLPGESHHRPLAQLEGGHKEVFEPVVAHQLDNLAPDRFLGSGTVSLGSLPDGSLQLKQLLVGLLLQQVQRAYLLAIKIGAEADQELAFGLPKFPLGPAVNLDPSAISKGQGLILLQGGAFPFFRSGYEQNAMRLLKAKES